MIPGDTIVLTKNQRGLWNACRVHTSRINNKAHRGCRVPNESSHICTEYFDGLQFRASGSLAEEIFLPALPIKCCISSQFDSTLGHAFLICTPFAASD